MSERRGKDYVIEYVKLSVILRFWSQFVYSKVIFCYLIYDLEETFYSWCLLSTTLSEKVPMIVPYARNIVCPDL